MFVSTENSMQSIVSKYSNLNYSIKVKLTFHLIFIAFFSNSEYYLHSSNAYVLQVIAFHCRLI